MERSSIFLIKTHENIKKAILMPCLWVVALIRSIMEFIVRGVSRQRLLLIWPSFWNQNFLEQSEVTIPTFQALPEGLVVAIRNFAFTLSSWIRAATENLPVTLQELKIDCKYAYQSFIVFWFKKTLVFMNFGRVSVIRVVMHIVASNTQSKCFYVIYGAYRSSREG